MVSVFFVILPSWMLRARSSGNDDSGAAVKFGVEPRVSVVNPVPVSNFNAVVVLALASGAM